MSMKANGSSPKAGLNVIAADNLRDGAEKIVAAVKACNAARDR